MPRCTPRIIFQYLMVVFITMSPESISKSAARPVRAYRSELRQQQAQLTRSRVLTAAAELFAERGYARTTLAKIAEAAGVSPETVQGQGPKVALLIAAVEYAAFGVSDEDDILNLEVGRRFVAIQDRNEALDHLVGAQIDVHVRTARIGPALIGAASYDPDVDRYLSDLNARINQQIRRILSVARERGWLREDLAFDELVETMAVISSVDTYLRLKRDGWTLDRYRAWYRRMMAENVFR